jgi:hypothetical protein
MTRSLWGGVAAGALLFTVGCGAAPGNTAVRAQEIPAGQQIPIAGPAQTATSPAAAPMVVSCEPHQRALVRPVLVNGATVSQVECITSDRLAAAEQVGAVPQAVPANYYPAAVTASAPVAYTQLPPARMVSAQETYRTARPVRARQVVYDEPVRVKKTRSVKKSAIIIGSSAGAGAGVGALVGGKKGALIGAAIGGGGAAIWDQITRR